MTNAQQLIAGNSRPVSCCWITQPTRFAARRQKAIHTPAMPQFHSNMRTRNRRPDGRYRTPQNCNDALGRCFPSSGRRMTYRPRRRRGSAP